MRLHLIGVSALVSAMEADAPLLHQPTRPGPLWDVLRDELTEPDWHEEAD